MTASVCDFTLDEARAVLNKRAGGLLRSGSHSPPIEPDNCQVCVEELRALACGLPWTDNPGANTETPTHTLCQGINDARYSSDQARTDICFPLVMLDEATAPDDWLAVFIEQFIRRVLPIILRQVAASQANADQRDALEKAAQLCETEGSANAANAAYAAANAAVYAAANAADAAADAAAYAANAANAANAADAAAAYAAANAANAAANAANAAYAANAANAADAASDEIMRLVVKIALRAHGRDDLVSEVR